MNWLQVQEDFEAWVSQADRFDGFDRGDRTDPEFLESEQQARNEHTEEV